ncbi:hypothetical protein CGS54_02820 [Faecalibacterium prausnitzii]|nr:hypothetical protein CGS54_02820 [Faecalibacterium prausnitzii]
MNFQPDCPGPGAVWLFWRGETLPPMKLPQSSRCAQCQPLWDGALGMAVKLPVKVQIFRACQRLPLRGSWQSRQALTEGVPSQMDRSFQIRHFREKAIGGFDFLLVFM